MASPQFATRDEITDLRASFNKLNDTITSHFGRSATPSVKSFADPEEHPDSPAPNQGFVRTRVQVLCKGPDDVDTIGGHEVMHIKANCSYGELCHEIAAKFKKVQNGDIKLRSNIPECVWTSKHKILMIKAFWSTVPIAAWATDNMTETIITEENCKDILGLMQDRKSTDALSVVISIPMV